MTALEQRRILLRFACRGRDFGCEDAGAPLDRQRNVPLDSEPGAVSGYAQAPSSHCRFYVRRFRVLRRVPGEPAPAG